jgi:hypothetical protein
MSDILEGIGTAAEGGLLARAMEPESGARPPHPDQPEKCLNCDTVLTGAYCHACGQQGHVHRTIGAFMHDLLHGALHFEGKLWRTLPMLAFKPGKLTRRYIEGQRARFVSPMALFLFTVFLMFAIFQVIGLTAPTGLTGLSNANVEGAISNVEEHATERRDAAKVALDALPADADNAARSAAQAELAEAEEVLEGVKEVQTLDLNDNASMTFSATGIDWLDDKLIKKWRADPDLMIYKLQANAYKFSWLLIPISIPFVWLLFAWKRRYKGYDHAIFVTYSLSFVTLLFVVLSILGKIGVGAVPLLMVGVVVTPIHMYKQLRHAYQLSRFSAFWRLMALSFFIWVVLILFFQLLLLLGLF